MRQRVKVFFDGGCRPNPGPIEIAVVVRGIAHVREGLGVGTNGDAEWVALLEALKVAQASNLEAFDLLGDSRTIIAQANATLVTGHASHPHAAALLALAELRRPARIRWIARAQNLAGIALAARHPR